MWLLLVTNQGVTEFNIRSLQAANDNQEHSPAAFRTHVAENQQVLFSSKSVAFFPKFDFLLFFFTRELPISRGDLG
jgi:hypothetical protein